MIIIFLKRNHLFIFQTIITSCALTAADYYLEMFSPHKVWESSVLTSVRSLLCILTHFIDIFWAFIASLHTKLYIGTERCNVCLFYSTCINIWSQVDRHYPSLHLQGFARASQGLMWCLPAYLTNYYDHSVFWQLITRGNDSSSRETVLDCYLLNT